MQRKKIQILNFFFKKSVSHVSICGGLDSLSLVRLGLYLLEYASLKGSGLESTKEMWREEEKQQPLFSAGRHASTQRQAQGSSSSQRARTHLCSSPSSSGHKGW